METRAIGLLVAGVVVVGGAILILAQPPEQAAQGSAQASAQSTSKSGADTDSGIEARGPGDKPTPPAGTRIPAQEPPEPTVPFEDASKAFDDALAEIEEAAAAGKVPSERWVELYTSGNKALDELRPHYDPREDSEVEELTEQTKRLTDALGKLEQR